MTSKVQIKIVSSPRVVRCKIEERLPFDTSSWQFGFFPTIAADPSRAIPQTRLRCAEFVLVRPEVNTRESAIEALIERAKKDRFCKLEIFYESPPKTKEDWLFILDYRKKHVDENRKMAHSA